MTQNPPAHLVQGMGDAHLGCGSRYDFFFFKCTVMGSITRDATQEENVNKSETASSLKKKI